MFYSGWPIHVTGWLTLRHRAADMHSLITLTESVQKAKAARGEDAGVQER
ncbi:hypothetical protein ABZ614_37415 [Streptomyces sp. NPDC013178]